MKRFALALVAVSVVLALARTPAAAQQPSAAGSGQDEKPRNDPKLVAVGGLGASAVYLSYLLIGVSADGFAKNVHDADKIDTIVDQVSSLLKTNSEQVEALRKGELTPEDAKYVDEMIALIGMVREYAKLLGDYAKGKDPKVAESFDQQRQKTWERLKKFLGVK